MLYFLSILSIIALLRCSYILVLLFKRDNIFQNKMKKLKAQRDEVT